MGGDSQLGQRTDGQLFEPAHARVHGDSGIAGRAFGQAGSEAEGEARVPERYARQALFGGIGVEGQARLAEASVLIVGMGALGAALANHLARAGVGWLRMVDRDYVEPSNLQRQLLYDEMDAKEALPKAEAAWRRLSHINSEIRLEPIVADVTPDNVELLVQEMQLVVDGTDNFQTRLLLNDVCFKYGIPFIYGGAVSAHGMTATFVPGETSCLRCLVGDAAGEGAGGQSCDLIGVISPVVDIIASYQATEALKLLVGARSALRGGLLTLDVWQHRTHTMQLPVPKPACPTCGTHHYPALAQEQQQVVTLCGRDTVQIAGRPLELTVWEQRLAQVAQVQRNPFLVRALLPEGERLVLFADGRVLVQGTEDIVRARTLYDRYIGS